MEKRSIYDLVLKDLSQKMVFIAGPRQVGKTTLAHQIAQDNFSRSLFLNWDYSADRKRILKGESFQEADLLIFDEIHKYPRWKNFVKGHYDVHGAHQRILVTGSARLDVYRRGGDSMMGRYYLHVPF